MKKALVSPYEPVHNGYRIADVVEISFSVAEPLFWIDCEDHVQPDVHFYDVDTQSIMLLTSKVSSSNDYSIQFE